MRSVFILVALTTSCAGDSADSSTDGASTGTYVGSYDDLPIADDDIQGLKALVKDKWVYFLYEMDKYNIVRDSSTNDAMVEKMELVFADSFEFNAYSL